MAAFYELRYWKNFEQPDGSIIRLEIHSKGIEGISFTAYEIGPVVQALALTIQGQTEDVDAPIVKTSLTMTFVDAPDHADSVLKKCGDWEEFYTNDSTYWKVLIKAKKDPSSASYAQLWGGYVTPDSFSEELRYRGSVTIVARDNIGHMQDFPFDAEGDENGLISLKELVETAWAKIESPMTLYWPALRWLQCEGVYAFDTRMNVSAFKNMNWYEAVEKALYSYGAVMRYNGENQVLLCSLRYMPQQARPTMDQVNHIEPIFVANAQRELVPAVRRIEETVDYELEDAVTMPQVKEADFTGGTQTYRCKIDGIDMGNGSFGTSEHDAPVWPIELALTGWLESGSTLFFNPDAYEIGYFSERKGLADDIYRYMYIACNNTDKRSVSFSRNITCSDMTVRMKLGQPVSLDKNNKLEQQAVFNLKKISYSIRMIQDGITNYLANDGRWVVGEQILTREYDAKTQNFDFEHYVPMEEYSGSAELIFTIYMIEYAQTSLANLAQYGLYACLQSLSFVIPESQSILKKNTVNTKYQEQNNVILSREPEIAPAYNTVALPGFIKNGIFYYDGNVIMPAKAWSWNEGTPQQMAVYNHLQLLCYHSKPNNLITGDIVNADVIKTAAIYVWGGKEHLLISGTYNYLNGHIEGAVLREFVRYDDMWGEVSGTSLPDTEQSSTTNQEGGGASSGPSSTNENTTNVVIGGEGGGSVTIDPFLSDTSSNPVESKAIKAYIDSADAEIHARIDELGQGGNGGGAKVRTLFVNDAGLSAEELSYNAETVQLIFAQQPMIFFASAEEGTPLSEYELMGMDNGRMVFAKYELNEYSTGATYIYLAMDGSTEVGGFNKSELDGDKYDSSLDADSTNAVQNKVVTENIRALEAAMPLMAGIDLDTIIAQDTPIDNATRNALLELGGYTAGDKYFSKGWIWSRGYLYTIKVIPTVAGVQIHVLSLKGWTEIAEDNSKVNHLPSQGGGNVEVDAELSETSENAVSNKAVTMALAETEEVAAAALNELNKRFDDYATKEDLEDALADVSIEVDSAMSDTSENAVSNKVIKKYVDDADKSVKEYVDDADKSVKEYVDDADNALSERISALERNSGGGNVEVDAELSESSTNAIANKAVTEAIVEDEEVISVALNQMNTRFDDYVPLDGLASEIQNAKDVIDASIIDNEEVAAAALVDLDKRLKDIIKILSNAGLIS
jgi:hypothetical protein